MEFKERYGTINDSWSRVLIESDWNLKEFFEPSFMRSDAVLIESDWNLKYSSACFAGYGTAVLIESDWNLKQLLTLGLSSVSFRINRIRLEFKVQHDVAGLERRSVLIESDWNLKGNRKH